MLTPEQEQQLHAAGYVPTRSQPGRLYDDWVAQVPGREVVLTFAKATRYTQDEIQMLCLRPQAYREAPEVPRPWTRQPTTALAKGYLADARWRFHDARWHHEVLGTVSGLNLPKSSMALLSKGTQDTLLEMYQAGVVATRLLREFKQQQGRALQEQALKEAEQVAQAEQVEQARQAGAGEPVSPAVPDPAAVPPAPALVPPLAPVQAPVSAPSSVDQLWRLLGKPDALQELLARAREERATTRALADEAQAAKVQAEEMLRQARQAVQVAQQAVVSAQILEADAEAKLKAAESEAAWALEHSGESELRLNALATLAGLGKVPEPPPVVPVVEPVAPQPVPTPEPVAIPTPEPGEEPDPTEEDKQPIRYRMARQLAPTGRKSSEEGYAMDAFMLKAGPTGATAEGALQHLREKGLDQARGARTFRDRVRYGIYVAV